MICSKCGELISVSENEVGQSVSCPKCGTAQTVQNTPVECVCNSCGQSLEIEAWMEGETADCPACQQPTVLRRPAAQCPVPEPAGIPEAPAAPQAPPVPHFRGAPAPAAAVPAPAPEPAPVFASASASAAPAPTPHFHSAPGTASHDVPQLNLPGGTPPPAMQAPDPALREECMRLISLKRTEPEPEAELQPPVWRKILSWGQRHAVSVGVAAVIVILLLSAQGIGSMFLSNPIQNGAELVQYVKNDDDAAVRRELEKASGKKRREILRFVLKDAKLHQSRSQKILTMLLKEKLVSPADAEMSWLADAAQPDGGWIFTAWKESGIGFNIPLHDGSTILEYAVDLDQQKIVDMLFAEGADPNVTDAAGKPLVFSALNTPEILKSFLRKEVKLNVRDWDMNTPLCGAAMLGRWDSMSLLLKQMMDASQVNDAGDTALTIALAHSKKAPMAILDRLLQIPCGVNVKNKKGKDALSIAIEHKQYVTALRLLAAGAVPARDFAKNVKENRWKNTLESEAERLSKAGVQEKTGSTEAVEETTPPYCGAGALFHWWGMALFALVWICAGLFAVGKYASGSAGWGGQIFNTLLLFLGPVVLLGKAGAMLAGKIRVRLSLLDQRLKKAHAEPEIVFCHADGSGCSAPENESDEVRNIAGQIMQKLLKARKKSILLSPDKQDTRVILQGGPSADAELFRLDPEKSRALIRFFKKLAELNVLEEAKPQCGKLAFHFGETGYFVSLSTIGMGGGGERAILTVRKGEAPVRTIEELPLTQQDRALLDPFLAGANGLLAVTAPAGNGRRTFVSLLLEACAERGCSAVWIGDGTEPGDSGKVPRVKAELGAGVTFRQMLQALEDYHTVAITFNRSTMQPKEIFELAAKKTVVLLADVPDGAGLKSILSRGTSAEDLQKILKLVVRPWLMPKLCHCAADDVPGPLLSRAWSVLGQGSAKKAAGCAECGYDGSIAAQVFYEIGVPETGRILPEPFPVWTAARLEACLMAGQGSVAAADVEKMLKGDC